MGEVSGASMLWILLQPVKTMVADNPNNDKYDSDDSHDNDENQDLDKCFIIIFPYK